MVKTIRDALYDGEVDATLDLLTPGGPWLVLADSTEAATALADEVRSDVGEAAVCAVGMDDPSWHLRAASVRPDGGAVVALTRRTPLGRRLEALRLLDTRLGPVCHLAALDKLPKIDAVEEAQDLTPGSASTVVRVAVAQRRGVAVVRARPTNLLHSPGQDHRRRRLSAVGVRVAAVGPQARALLEGWEHTVDSHGDGGENPRPRWHERDAACPDLVVVDPGIPEPAEAAGVGAGTVRLESQWPRVRPAEANPIGFVRSPTRGAVDVEVAGPMPPRLHQHRIARVDAGASAPRAVAARVVDLAARGMPAVVLGAVDLSPWLSPALAAAVASVDADADDDARERASIALRRAALRDHSVDTLVRDLARRAGLAPREPPTASVLLATSRPGFLSHALAQVSAQTYQPRELVLVLHGQEVAAAARPLLAGYEGALTVRQVDGDVPFGTALNVGCEAAAGEVIAKMDDDDWYSPEHLADMVLALRYSGAQLVGKAAEFLYLDAIDVTVRRSVNGSERFSGTVSGATLALHRADLHEVGGWAAAARAIDRRLVEAVEAQGGRAYRTHGLGFLVNRHSEGSTWQVGSDYFLRQAVRQWPGLARQQAAIDG